MVCIDEQVLEPFASHPLRPSICRLK
uniref:Uncharacterized protein n=1 Tax=Anguilla anguilla TaxID=7936 RepID=A0A0E9S8G7_ANGAN